MREIPRNSPTPAVANSTEGSNPFLTALARSRESDKFLTRGRFWPMFEERGEADCWPWKRAIDREGYGRFTFEKKRKFAHRIAYLLAYGEIPRGLKVLHRCDNPICVNPAHLFLGSHQDNMSDRNGKGRTAKGERNGRAKLTESQVGEIRDWRKVGASYRSIASRFGINDKTVRQICSGKLWRGE